MAATMPPEGTQEPCVFCREPVTLRRADSGARHWLRPGDPADGGHYCLGGMPRRSLESGGNLQTLHKPDAYAWWYNAAGEAQYPAQRFTPRRAG